MQERMRALAASQRREQLIQDCERNNGVECDREVDTQLRAEGIQEGRRVIRTVPPPVSVSPSCSGHSLPRPPRRPRQFADQPQLRVCPVSRWTKSDCG